MLVFFRILGSSFLTLLTSQGNLCHSNGYNTCCCFLSLVLLWLPADPTIEYIPFYLPSVSPGRLRAPWRQGPSLDSQSLVSTGLSVTLSSLILLPKLQIYIPSSLWTSLFGELNILEIELIVFQIPKHLLVLCFLPAWIGNIIYPAAETESWNSSSAILFP